MLKIKYFLFIVIAGLLVSSCEKKDNSVIDPILHFPTIDSAYITPTTFDTNSIHMDVFAHVISEEPILRVTAQVKNPFDSVKASVDLVVGSNNQYTGQIDFVMDCRLIGQYRVEFIAQNNSNLYSNAYPVSFNVTRINNHKPVISNLIIAPKDFIINTPSYIVFLVTASDPDGLCDIKNVHYFGTQPHGGILTEHGLYDDGSCCLVEYPPQLSGDTTANDGRYTRFFGGVAPDSLGYYRYHIVAIDRSGDTSNVLSDSIFVHN